MKKIKDDKKQQELILKLGMYEQQIQQVQQQLEAIEHGIVELDSLNTELDEIKGSEGKEIMAQIGRGIFIKSKILSDELIVDVGGKNFVKKTVPETQELINKQLEKLEEAKESLNNSIIEISNKAEELVEEFKGKD